MIVEANKIKAELAKVGINIEDIYDLVNTDKPYPTAIPVLLNLLKQGIEHSGIKEGVIRALAVKEGIGLASPVLIDEYYKTPKDKMLLRWAIGNAIYMTITSSDTENVLQIVENKENGMSRQMFVLALSKVKSEEVENVLIKLLDDDEVAAHAIEALGKMKSQKSKEKIFRLLDHPKDLIRKEAKKAIKNF
ncbi:HEAT repeat domain-containing protein [Flavobacterium salmonis]|uniref:HEAT repeat-containing protein n=1 Tax=Flavobacterium salmonis TaxID=2654844 RepID=A0A6V6YSC1_9FLAO|nr:HEAT repeat domain-containing protein [Flavobacterium salmonis]CAD0002418.1 hypothetical protein FLAT13_01124 [Flavobacterium salmonis]